MKLEMFFHEEINVIFHDSAINLHETDYTAHYFFIKKQNTAAVGSLMIAFLKKKKT